MALVENMAANSVTVTATTNNGHTVASVAHSGVKISPCQVARRAFEEFLAEHTPR